jgi:hypothetical protein
MWVKSPIQRYQHEFTPLLCREARALEPSPLLKLFAIIGVIWVGQNRENLPMLTQPSPNGADVCWIYSTDIFVPEASWCHGSSATSPLGDLARVQHGVSPAWTRAFLF